MISPSSIAHFALSAAAALTRSSTIPSRPVHLTIEPTNICTLRCPVCETGNGTLRRPKGLMRLPEFKTILDNIGGQVNTILMYYMGEPLLCPDIYDMLAEATERGIRTEVCTNGERVNAKRLIESGVSEVSFQVGGMRNTHALYRVGGDFDRVCNNIRETVEERNRVRAKTKVCVGYIVMRHNEGQLYMARPYFEGLGVDSVDTVTPCVRTMEQGRQFLPESPQYWYYDHTAFEAGELRTKVVPHNQCPWIYFSTVVTWSGGVVPCCRDAQGDSVMGNALMRDFADIWNGGKYREFREAIKTRQKDMSLCRLCSGYGVPLLRTQ